MRIDLFCPFGLRESHRAEYLSMLFKADPYVPFTLSEELCRLVQFDVASDKHRPRVSSAKRCHALDHGNCLQAQFLQSSSDKVNGT